MRYFGPVVAAALSASMLVACGDTQETQESATASTQQVRDASASPILETLSPASVADPAQAGGGQSTAPPVAVQPSAPPPPPPTPPPPQEPPRTSVPQEVQGYWEDENSQLNGYLIGSYGEYLRPSGWGAAWEFTPDGYYTHATLLQQSGLDWYCFESGTAAVAGDAINLYPTNLECDQSISGGSGYWGAQKTFIWRRVLGPESWCVDQLWLESGSDAWHLRDSDGQISAAETACLNCVDYNMNWLC